MIANLKQAVMAQGWLESEAIAMEISLADAKPELQNHARQVIEQFQILNVAFSETLKQLQAAELKLAMIETALRT